MIPSDSPLELAKLRHAELIALRCQLIDITSLARAIAPTQRWLASALVRTGQWLQGDRPARGPATTACR